MTVHSRRRGIQHCWGTRTAAPELEGFPASRPACACLRGREGPHPRQTRLGAWAGSPSCPARPSAAAGSARKSLRTGGCRDERGCFSGGCCSAASCRATPRVKSMQCLDVRPRMGETANHQGDAGWAGRQAALQGSGAGRRHPPPDLGSSGRTGRTAPPPPRRCSRTRRRRWQSPPPWCSSSRSPRSCGGSGQGGQAAKVGWVGGWGRWARGGAGSAPVTGHYL